MPGQGAAGASYGDLLVTSLVVLGAVCVAAFVVVRVVGRLLATGRARGSHLLDVIARLPLEPRRSLYVVDVAGKTLLVGTSEMGLSVLSELDGAEVRARVTARPRFGELVRTAWLRRRGVGSQGPDDGGGAQVPPPEGRQTEVAPGEQPAATPGEQPAVTPGEQPAATPRGRLSEAALGEQRAATPRVQPEVTPQAQSIELPERASGAGGRVEEVRR